MINKGPVYSKSFEFAINSIHLYKELKADHEYVISDQLLRSGTGIGANVNEASAAESRKDFVHKMSHASKEARESLYWLKLLEESDLTCINVQKEMTECTELIKILTSIVKTSRQKQGIH